MDIYDLFIQWDKQIEVDEERPRVIERSWGWIILPIATPPLPQTLQELRDQLTAEGIEPLPF